MFEHIDRELLHSLHAKYDTIMATLAQVQAAQADEATAIQALATRVSQLPAPAATEADLDGIVSTAQSNTAAINAIDPAQAAPAA